MAEAAEGEVRLDLVFRPRCRNMLADGADSTFTTFALQEVYWRQSRREVVEARNDIQLRCNSVIESLLSLTGRLFYVTLTRTQDIILRNFIEDSRGTGVGPLTIDTRT